MPRSTIHRILGALEQMSLLTRLAGGTEYRLGPELIVLGARAQRAFDIRTIARPELKALNEATGENITLDILDGWEVLILDEVKGRGLLGLETEVGTRWPAHASGTGKVFLAFAGSSFPEKEATLRRFTEHTIVSWDVLNDALDVIRDRGYATNVEELESGYTTVAAPVLGRDGVAEAAISVGGSVHRVTRDRIPELADLVKAAAQRISERLGYRRENERPLGVSVSIPL
jgi:DNA-binding IclR family transcriptional regulator